MNNLLKEVSLRHKIRSDTYKNINYHFILYVLKML